MLFFPRRTDLDPEHQLLSGHPPLWGLHALPSRPLLHPRMCSAGLPCVSVTPQPLMDRAAPLCPEGLTLPRSGPARPAPRLLGLDCTDLPLGLCACSPEDAAPCPGFPHPHVPCKPQRTPQDRLAPVPGEALSLGWAQHCSRLREAACCFA